MKKVISVLLFVMCFILTACGSTLEKPSVTESENTDTIVDNTQKEEQVVDKDTIEGGGITLKFIAAHKTEEENGDPVAALEFEYTNNNGEAYSVWEIASITVFQDGIECYKDELVLKDGFDWDSGYTAIKDGATLTTFVANSLRNLTSPIEIHMNLYNQNWDYSDKNSQMFIDSAVLTAELVD